MSGFITTMFVPPIPHSPPNTSFLYSSYPAKPKPLQPVFTFTQGQSYMNHGMEILDQMEIDTVKNPWTGAIDGILDDFPAPPGSLAPARPQMAYTSPLQRIGEKLRTHQAGTTCKASTQEDVKTEPLSAVPKDADLLLTSAQARLKAHFKDQNGPDPGYSNYSYNLIAGDRDPTIRSNVPRNVHGSSGTGYEGCSGIGAFSSLETKAQEAQHNTKSGDKSLPSSIFSNPRTQRAPFKPQKSSRGTSSWQLKQYAEATLGSGSLRKAVKLPEGEDKDEWLAVNVVDFYNQINLLYGSITEFCSPQSCPEMKATDEFEYLWQDNEAFKKPTKMSAPEYIEHLMAWIQSNVDNETQFPSRIGVPFPKSFASLIRNMFKRLYRVYAHIYCHHYPVIIELGLEPHLNTSFKHYVLFIDEHGLASGSKDFWGPLGDLVESMLRSD